MHESHARTLAALRKWSVLLDSAFRVPGTQLTFGLDPILGLIPGIGDLTTPIFAVLLLLAQRPHAHSARRAGSHGDQRRDRLARSDCIPVVGDLFDFGWKANVRNLALLERHAHPGSKATRGDWIFVLSIIGILIALAVTPLLLAAWLLSRFRLF